MSDRFIVKSRLRDYEVEFVDDFVAAINRQRRDDAFLISDERINELYPEMVKKPFADDCIIALQASEDSKTMMGCEGLIKELVKKNIRKNSVIFALGGGVIEDIAGFISTILFRGIDWVFCPTTLLAQVDSCIGSKSSINLGGYKNLVGSFYPPSLVIIDVKFLKTLPIEELKSGIGEILHFYLIAGKEKLAQKLMEDYERLLSFPQTLKDYILPSLKIKKSIVEIDELDKDQRNLFNYGHTFGHAIEAVTSYGINHGQAVTMGMDVANYLSLRLGHIDEKTFKYMHGILEKNMPSFKVWEQNSAEYFKALSKDKKNLGNNLGCILTRGPGSMFKIQLPFDGKLKSDIISYFNRNF